MKKLVLQEGYKKMVFDEFNGKIFDIETDIDELYREFNRVIEVVTAELSALRDRIKKIEEFIYNKFNEEL
jgi:septation ring formation regulator EzrA